MNFINALFLNSPYPVKCAAASLGGAYLDFLRYGPETETLVEEALARDAWDFSAWQSWQKPKLRDLLIHAAAHVPYYRDYWAARKSAGDSASWETLENWPVLDKETIQKNPKAFLSDGPRSRFVFWEHTSGTTGSPLKVALSRKEIRFWYALFEARWRRWYGLRRGERWAIIGGRQVVGSDAAKPPFWVWNASFRQLYLSAYHLSADSALAYIKALESHKVDYIYAYSSALYALALSGEAMRVSPPALKAVVTNAEPLLASQREKIRNYFGCPVYETYGMSEMVSGASECRSGKMHLWPDAGVYEVQDDRGDLFRAGTGALVATGLFHETMPLIRYRVGDRVELSDRESQCSCGANLPVLESVEGRCDDMILTADGKMVGRMDPVFKSGLPILEAQIIQESLSEIRVLVVARNGYTNQTDTDLAERIKERLGPVRVTIEKTDRIPRAANGKFRAVISRVPMRSAPERKRS